MIQTNNRNLRKISFLYFFEASKYAIYMIWVYITHSRLPFVLPDQLIGTPNSECVRLPAWGKLRQWGHCSVNEELQFSHAMGKLEDPWVILKDPLHKHHNPIENVIGGWYDRL